MGSSVSAWGPLPISFDPTPRVVHSPIAGLPGGDLKFSSLLRPPSRKCTRQVTSKESAAVVLRRDNVAGERVPRLWPLPQAMSGTECSLFEPPPRRAVPSLVGDALSTRTSQRHLTHSPQYWDASPSPVSGADIPRQELAAELAATSTLESASGLPRKAAETSAPRIFSLRWSRPLQPTPRSVP